MVAGAARSHSNGLQVVGHLQPPPPNTCGHGILKYWSHCPRCCVGVSTLQITCMFWICNICNCASSWDCNVGRYVIIGKSLDYVSNQRTGPESSYPISRWAQSIFTLRVRLTNHIARGQNYVHPSIHIFLLQSNGFWQNFILVVYIKIFWI
jgi:hypothetical protein